MQRKKNNEMKILLANRKIERKADPQIAHLQFARANAKTKNCKRAIFCQSHEINLLICK
jgi:hypothetical protein